MIWYIFDPIIMLLSQNSLRNHILQPQLPIQKSYVVCVYVQNTDISFTYKVLEANTHVPHHTQRRGDREYRWGQAPIGSIIFPLCVVWHVCVSLRHFAREYYVCVLHIYTHYIWYLYGQLWLKNMISESILAEKYAFWVICCIRSMILGDNLKNMFFQGKCFVLLLNDYILEFSGKTQMKRAASEKHWELPSPPIMEKNMWFPYSPPLSRQSNIGGRLP